MPSRGRRWDRTIRYGVAILTLAAAFGLLDSWPEVAIDAWTLVLLVAVTIASAVGGFGPGFLTTLVASLAALFWIPWVHTTSDFVRLSLFVGLGICTAITSHLVRRANRQREERIAREATEREIARRHEAERVLVESDRRLRSLVESNVVGVVFFEEDRIVDANRAFHEMLGAGVGHLISKPHAEITMAKDHPLDQAALESLERHGRFEPYEKRYLRVDGSSRHALIGGASIEGGPRRWMAFVLDVEQRKRAEAEREDLLARERRARRAAEISVENASFLANTTSVLSSSLDYRTTLQRVAELVVPRLADFCSIELLRHDGDIDRVAAAQSAQQWPELGERIWTFVPARDNPDNPVVKTLRSGRTEWMPWATDEWMRTIATSPEHLDLLKKVGPRSFVCVPIALRGRVLGALTFCFGPLSDRIYTFTEVSVAQELAARCAVAVDNALLYAETQDARAEAESASRAREEFLAVLSHELRTPMNTVSILVNVLRSGRLAPEKQGQALETIDRNLRVQLRLLEDLLDTSRIISGKLRIELRSTPLRSCVERAIESVRPTIDEKQLAFAVDLGNEDLSVRADPERLQQVLVNVIGNAVKFTPQGGSVRVHVSSDGSTAVIETVESGSGIRPEFLPHVFEPFRQAAGPNEGLGLGLAISRRIVTLHGGEIRAASDGEGRGSTFTIVLPLADASAEAALALGDRPLQGMRVLVADGAGDALHSTGATLSALGADVTVAGSAAEALDRLAIERPDALVTDSPIPDLDELDLVRRIRKAEREAGHEPLPIIALSAHPHEKRELQALAAGFDAFLSKPVRADLLADTVRNFVNAKPTAQGSDATA